MLLYQTGIKLSAGAIPPFDINLKELQEQGKLAAIDAMRKQQEAEQQFQALKTHYDAGIAAITQMKAAQTKLAQTPKDQQDPVKAEITHGGRHGGDGALCRAGTGEAGRSKPLHRFVPAWAKRTRA